MVEVETTGKVFRGIWYRSRPMTQVSFRDAFNRDRGRLVISPNRIEFIGKHDRIVIDNITSLSMGAIGKDIVNCWLAVEYRDNNTKCKAFFADGKGFGYGGMFGGTHRILKAIQSTFPYARFVPEDNSYLTTQFILLVVLVLLILRIYVAWF